MAKRPYSTMPINRKESPRKTLKSLYPAGLPTVENVPPLPSHAHHLSPPPGAPDAGRVQLSPLSNSELNGASRPSGGAQSPAGGAFIPVNNAGFTAVNTPPPVGGARESSRDPHRHPSKEPQHASPVHKHRHTHSYTSPYEPASRPLANSSHAPESRSAPPLHSASAPPPGPQGAVSAPKIANGANGTGMRDSPNMHHIQHANIAPQPHSLAQPQSSVQAHSSTQAQTSAQPPGPGQPQHQLQASLPPHSSPYSHGPAQLHSQGQQQTPYKPRSRANTPGAHTSRVLAPHPSSRSSTPLAQAASNQPHTAPNTQAPPAPIIQSAPAYGIQLVPTQDIPTTASGHRAPPVQPPQAAPHHPSTYQPVLKSQPPEVSQITQAPPAHARSTIATNDLRLLQCEATAGLFTFFYPRSTAPPDESALLQRLHTLWYHGEPLFRNELGAHFDLVSKILTAWLHERQAITALRHSFASQPGVTHVGLVDRLLAMNDLRVMRLKWKNMSPVDGLSPEDLLCQAFRVMTNTEGSEYLFKDGLERLNGGVFEFLRSEDAKIVMQRR